MFTFAAISKGPFLFINAGAFPQCSGRSVFNVTSHLLLSVQPCSFHDSSLLWAIWAADIWCVVIGRKNKEIFTAFPHRLPNTSSLVPPPHLSYPCFKDPCWERLQNVKHSRNFFLSAVSVEKLTESSSPAVCFKGGSVRCQKDLLAFIFLAAAARSRPAFPQPVFSFCAFFSHSCFIFAVKV